MHVLFRIINSIIKTWQRVQGYSNLDTRGFPQSRFDPAGSEPVYLRLPISKAMFMREFVLIIEIKNI